MRLLAFLQMNNEIEKGNLVRCLNNCKQWADDIVIYDDGSTDSSVEIARQYTEHIICGKERCFVEELAHKQRLLEYAIGLSPDWIFWIDADEIIDRNGTTGALRLLAETAAPDARAFAFQEVNLWQSETYCRIDGPFSTSRFVRLWRVIPGMHIKVERGLDHPSYPCHIKTFSECDIRVLHYKFADYKKLMWGAGFGRKTKDELIDIAKDNFIFDQRNCRCLRVPIKWFPPENIPEDRWPEPQPVQFEDMKTHEELP